MKIKKTKKLFLASAIAFTMDRFLEVLDDSPKNLTVGFVATAADPYEDKWFVEDDRKKFKETGFKLKEVDLKGKNFKKLIKDFEEEYEVYEKHRNEYKNEAIKLTNHQAIVVEGNNYRVVKSNV